MDDLRGRLDAPGEPLRLIAIDDEADWCSHLAITARIFGYTLDSAQTVEEARLKIQEAEQQGRPYHAAIVDMNFEMGKKKIELPRGKEVLKYLKSNHPLIACIMVSGSESISPETVLDLRDDFDLDYYLGKAHFDIDTFNQAIQKAVRRVRAVRSGGLEELRLQRLLEQYRGIYLNVYKNLANAQERKAMKGVDVDVATLNEIARYKEELREAEGRVRDVEQQLVSIRAD